MNRLAKSLILFGVVYTALSQSIAYGVSFQLKSFGPEVYNSDPAIMDAALGLNAYTIESFEGTTLLPGLSVTFVGHFSGPNAVPIGPVTSSFITYSGAQNAWDGTKRLSNQAERTGEFFFRTRTVFTLPSNVNSFGVGLSDLHRFPAIEHWPVELFVNGTHLARLQDLPDFKIVDDTATVMRNGYLIVTALDPQSFISSVEFRQPQVFEHGNSGNAHILGIEFDHLAIGLVPEPSSLALAAFGALGSLIAARRKRWCFHAN